MVPNRFNRGTPANAGDRADLTGFPSGVPFPPGSPGREAHPSGYRAQQMAPPVMHPPSEPHPALATMQQSQRVDEHFIGTPRDGGRLSN